tara:strand:- start:764 stop:1393 length:630 start_codon:yes stop_codon:yes gene_type:complete
MKFELIFPNSSNNLPKFITTSKSRETFPLSYTDGKYVTSSIVQLEDEYLYLLEGTASLNQRFLHMFPNVRHNESLSLTLTSNYEMTTFNIEKQETSAVTKPTPQLEKAIVSGSDSEYEYEYVTESESDEESDTKVKPAVVDTKPEVKPDQLDNNSNYTQVILKRMKKAKLIDICESKKIEYSETDTKTKLISYIMKRNKPSEVRNTIKI